MKKILLSSDCNGNFQLLFSKVSQLSQKNKFDIMFLAGNVLPLQASQQFGRVCKGEIKVPIPTYFITTGLMSKILNLTYPEGKQFAENFVFLGQKGIRKLDGLNVCWLNGLSSVETLKDDEYKGELYDSQDVKNLIQQVQNKPIDILITNQWPQEISANYSKVVLQQFESPCQRSELVSLLCYKLSPKYHLAASGRSFYRMQPFRSLNKSSTYTHFVNVAEMNKNGLKDKYLLAVQTFPLEMNPPEEIINNSISSPFAQELYEVKSKQLIEGKISEKGEQTKFTQDTKQIGFKDSLKLKENKNKQQTANFINQDTYVYFDGIPYQARNEDVYEFLQRWGKVNKIQIFKQHKGGFKSGIAKFSTLQETKQCLADTGKFSLYQSRIKFKPKQIEQKYRHQDCWFCQKNEKFDRSLLVYKGKYCMVCLDKGPVTEWHLQIVPVNHVDTIGKLERVQVEEIQHVIKELKRYFRERNYQTIIAQRNMKLSQQISHTLIQFIAVSQQKGLIHRFYQLIQEQRLSFTATEEYNKRKSEYFVKIQVNDTKFLKEIWPKQKIQFEFLRKVICELINQPGKINWRACERSEEALRRFRQEVKTVLKECHFTVQ